MNNVATHVRNFIHVWRRKWQPTPLFLPGECHGRKSLVGYSPRGRKKSDMTEQLHFHFMNNRSSLNNSLNKVVSIFTLKEARHG